MSDGLTDGYRSSMAAERRYMFLRSLADCLKDPQNVSLSQMAMNDIMAHESALYPADSASNREARAADFLDRLHQGDRATWASLLAFAIRDCAGLNRGCFFVLKDMSPFCHATIVIAKADGSSLRLGRTDDIEYTIARQAGLSCDKLAILDLSVTETYDLKP